MYLSAVICDFVTRLIRNAVDTAGDGAWQNYVSNMKVPVLWSSLRCYVCHWDCLFKHMIYLTCLIHFEELNFIKWSVFYKLTHFILLDMLKTKSCFKVYQRFLVYRIAIQDEIASTEVRLPKEMVEIV